MQNASTVTKILFFDNDETSFQFRQCMAKVLGELPPIELYHATDATEALAILDNIQPNVVVLDSEGTEEREFFIENLDACHPPIVMQTEGTQEFQVYQEENQMTCIPKNESLAGIHQTLLVLTTIAAKAGQMHTSAQLH